MVMQGDEIWSYGPHSHYGQKIELYYIDTIYPILRTPDSFMRLIWRFEMMKPCMNGFYNTGD